VRQGLLVPADAIVAVRSGDPDRAVEIIERGWSHAEGVLNGPQLRALHLIDAFACALANHEASDVQQAIAGARPFRPGEYRALASQWPELRDFIEKHGLS
jgi:hypothetical protein